MPKDEFSIEPRYAHKKNLDKSEKENHFFETDHPRALKGGGHLFLSLALLSKKDSGQPLCRVVPGTV